MVGAEPIEGRLLSPYDVAGRAPTTTGRLDGERLSIDRMYERVCEHHHDGKVAATTAMVNETSPSI